MSIVGGRVGLWTLRQRAATTFSTVDFFRSRPGTHVLGHEIFRFPGTNPAPLDLDLQSWAWEAVLLRLWLLRVLQGTLIPCGVWGPTLAGTAGKREGGVSRGQNWAQPTEPMSLSTASQTLTESLLCARPGCTGARAQEWEGGRNKTQVPSAKSVREATFPKVGPRNPNAVSHSQNVGFMSQGS